MRSNTAFGGVGIYVNSKLNYSVIEIISKTDFQALLVEVKLFKRKYITCGVAYRQHSSPEAFLTYNDDTIESIV